MSDWYGGSRTNYVKIKDMDGLKKALEPFDLEIVEDRDSPNSIALLPNSEYGDWPTWAYTEDGEEIELDPVGHICPFMEEGQVLVIMEAGAERLRYISGWAQAFTWDGRFVEVSLHQIYEKAAQEFGVPLTTITPASY